MWEAVPSEMIQIMFGTLSHLMDIINCAKFNIDWSTDFGLWTSKKCMFPFESKVVLNNVFGNIKSNGNVYRMSINYLRRISEIMWHSWFALADNCTWFRLLLHLQRSRQIRSFRRYEYHSSAHRYSVRFVGSATTVAVRYNSTVYVSTIHKWCILQSTRIQRNLSVNNTRYGKQMREIIILQTVF